MPCHSDIPSIPGQNPPQEADFSSGQGLVSLGADGSLGQAALVQGVLQAIHCVEASQLCPVAPDEAGIAFQPKTLLAILAYTYAMGILSSKEVEHALQNDPLVRLLCQDELPNREVLSHFRRCNRHALRFILHTACMSTMHPTLSSIPAHLVLPDSQHAIDDSVRVQALSRRVTGLIDSLIDKSIRMDNLHPDP